MPNNPAVLPDARARLQEAANRKLGFRSLRKPNDRMMVRREDLQWLLDRFPECDPDAPPVSDAAVPAGELPEVMPGHWSTAGGRDMALATLDDPNMARSRERISDFALANEVFLSPGIVNLTDAKERIRWLSAELAVALTTPPASDAAVPAGEVKGILLPPAPVDDPTYMEGWLDGQTYLLLNNEPDTAPKVASDTGAGLREALQASLEFACLTLAFHGRDRGTDRQERMLDDLEELARKLDAQVRKALATPPASDAAVPAGAALEPKTK